MKIREKERKNKHTNKQKREREKERSNKQLNKRERERDMYFKRFSISQNFKIKLSRSNISSQILRC